MHAGLGRRHPEHAREGTKVDLTSLLVATRSRSRIEAPAQDAGLTVSEPEVVVERRGPAGGERRTPGADPHLVDPHLERLSGLRPADLERPDQRVTVVELRFAWLEPVGRCDMPACVEAGEGNRVATVDRQDRRQVPREVAVERAPLERDLVDHARGSPIQASRGASRTRSPPRRPPSKNSWIETACQSSAERFRATSAGT